MEPTPTPSPPSARSFRGPVLTLLSGSSLALALSYLAQPLLTRLYTPEAFGGLDAFVALVSLLFVCSTLRYEDALLLPRCNAEALGLLRLAGYILAGLSLLCLLLSFPAQWLLQHRGETTLAPWLPWLAPTLLLMGSTRLAELWLTRQQAFRTLSVGTALRATTTTTLRLAAGLPPLQAGTAGLIGGFLGGHLSTLLLYGWHLRHRLSTPAASPSLAVLARRYRHFPLFTLPAALLNALSMRLPFLLLLLFFDAEVLGFFGRAFMVLTVPLGLVGSATGQVFFVRAAEARHGEGLRALTRRVYSRLLQIGLYPVLLLMLLGPELFAFIFGAPWRTAGVYAAWIAPWLLLASLASPLSRLFDVLERQRADFATSALLFLLQTIALITGGLQGQPATALLLLGLAGLLGRVFQLSVLFRLVGVTFRDAFGPLLRCTLYSLPLLGLLYFSASWLSPPLYLGGAMLSVLLYLGLSTWMERRLVQSLP
ncbi:lipopolysaccharide biosynthesis protein [Rhodothermus profundi]|uniref:Membrane protein involved in the export of O-antigen and teichoic acid n=1 Tax=Rhodothermus profundi TaxID=633813 RepID=A0A1M6PDQ7_9BACT|nr:oligosaccharide flippase family protein [Rhodothermus profundi]SHK06057.1 Membrane protein involved in the export of O-antigen and teichoic acid [Rhodothermus profundi]